MGMLQGPYWELGLGLPQKRFEQIKTYLVNLQRSSVVQTGKVIGLDSVVLCHLMMLRVKSVHDFSLLL